MKIYMTRHGESELNNAERISGIQDVALSELGIEQAHVLAQKLAGKKIDLIISSPLQRAVKTAEIANEVVGTQIIIDKRLIEINFGIYEGVSRYTPEFQAVRTSFAYKFPNGESTFMVVQRVFNFLDEIKAKYPDKTVLIVSHGVVCKIINAYCVPVTDAEFNAFKMGNCDLYEYEI
jgi:broad specificity phosphatase PhoE